MQRNIRDAPAEARLPEEEIKRRLAELARVLLTELEARRTAPEPEVAR